MTLESGLKEQKKMKVFVSLQDVYCPRVCSRQRISRESILNKSESSFKPVVETERSIDHIGSEKTPIRYSTAVRNIGQ